MNTDKHRLFRWPTSFVFIGVHLWLLCVVSGCASDPSRVVNRKSSPDTGFVTRTIESRGGDRVYQVFIPHDYTPMKQWPVIIFLHGLGEAGTDGRKQTTVGLGPEIARRRGEFPAIVIFPQVQGDWRAPQKMEFVIRILDQTARQYSIDPRRVSVTGLSTGGYGTWNLVSTYPERFSAAVPIAAYPALDRVPSLTRVPVWAFHNANDPVVSPGGTRAMIDALKQAGASVRYTEYSKIGHDAWTRAYRDQELLEWMLAQRR